MIDELFGAEKKENESVKLAVILRFLAELLESDDDDEGKDEREREAREIPVRPRVEPLGGM